MTAVVTGISPWQLFMMGGPMMWPLLVCSVLTLMVIIQKFGQGSFLNKGEDLLKDVVVDRVRKNDIKGAVAACDGAACFLAPVLRAGLIKFGMAKEDIVAAMEERVRVDLPGLEKGLGMLSTIAHVAPLLGLLGTVLGLCGAFHFIQMRAAALNPAMAGDVAAGVWQSLVTTAAGLVVGIVALMAHDHFTGRIVDAVVRMEKTSAVLVDAMIRSSEPSVEDRPSFEDRLSLGDEKE